MSEGEGRGKKNLPCVSSGFPSSVSLLFGLDDEDPASLLFFFCGFAGFFLLNFFSNSMMNFKHCCFASSNVARNASLAAFASFIFVNSSGEGLPFFPNNSGIAAVNSSHNTPHFGNSPLSIGGHGFYVVWKFPYCHPKTI